MKNRNNSRFLTSSALSAGFLLLLLSVARGQTGYLLTDLGTLDPTNITASTFAAGINARGEVVGSSAGPDGQNHAFVYSKGVMHDLGVGGASSINNRGQIAGYLGNFPTGNVVLLTGDRIQVITSGYASATGVNERGEVCGWFSLQPSSEDPYIYNHAFLYSGGQFRDLGTLGGTTSQANGINNRGQVVGQALVSGQSGYLLGQNGHGFLYSGGRMIDLGVFPGGSYSRAMGINEHGQVVGSGNFHFESWPIVHPFIYSGGVMRNIVTAASTDWYFGLAINNAGVVVGFDYNDHAQLFVGGRVVYLASMITSSSPGNPPGAYRLAYAIAINDAGQIVINGDFFPSIDNIYHHTNHAYLLTPVSPRSTLMP